MQILAQYFKTDYVQKCLNEQNDTKRRQCRDEIIDGRIRAIDLHFNAFQKELFREGVSSNIAVDWTALGLNAAGAVDGGAITKLALAATSGGLVGQRGLLTKTHISKKPCLRSLPA